MPARSGSAATRSSRPAPVRRRSTRSRIAPDAPRLMIGLALMILGVATGIALLLPGAGKLTDLWRDSIAPWVGSGRRILPFAMLTVGWWMVNRAKGVRADWELTIFGASVSFCASLGLIELIIPRSGGIIGKALAHNLPGLITIPGTGILLAAVMTAGNGIAQPPINILAAAAVRATVDEALREAEFELSGGMRSSGRGRSVRTMGPPPWPGSTRPRSSAGKPSRWSLAADSRRIGRPPSRRQFPTRGPRR